MKVTDVEGICAMVKLMFAVKLTPSDFENVVNVDPDIAAFYAERRHSANAKQAAVAASMEQVVRLCAGIHKSLVATVLPGILHRYTVPGSPHSSNRDLVDYVHAQIASSYTKIPGFLRLADECLACTDDGAARFKMGECPFNPEQVRNKIAVLKNLVFSAWSQFARSFGDAWETDAETVEFSRVRWALYTRRELGYGAKPGTPSNKWMKQPGNWVPAGLDLDLDEINFPAVDTVLLARSLGSSIGEVFLYNMRRSMEYTLQHMS